MKNLKYVGWCLLLISIIYIAYVLGGWVVLLILLAIPLSFVLFLLFLAYDLGVRFHTLTRK